MKSTSILRLFALSVLLLAAGAIAQGLSMIPPPFKGTWIEKGQDGKQIAKMEISDTEILWKQNKAPAEAIPVELITSSEANKVLTFPSKVVVAHGVFLSPKEIMGDTSVKLSVTKNNLVVEISGIKVKGEGGLIRPKVGTTITTIYKDGQAYSVIEYPPEIHTYTRIRNKGT